MGRRPSQPVPSDSAVDLDMGGADTSSEVDVPATPEPPIYNYDNDAIADAIRNARRIQPEGFSDNTFDLNPNAHTDAVRDAEGNPLSDLEMTTRAFRHSSEFLEDDEEGSDEGFGEGEDVDDETRNERDFLLDADEEEGGEDEGEEGDLETDEDGEENLLDEDEDGETAPRIKKSRADKVIEEALAKQKEEFERQIAELQKPLNDALAQAEKLRQEALKQQAEANLNTEKQKQILAAQNEVRAKHPDLEELDSEAFNDLVDLRVSKWEAGRRAELDKEIAAQQEQERSAYMAEQAALARQKEYASYKTNLPRGHELMGVELGEGTQETWADLVAGLHEFFVVNAGPDEVPAFGEFASRFAPMLKAVHQRGFRAGAAKATQRAARGKSAPPPITSDGGGGRATEKSNGKPEFQVPTNLSSWVPNFFGDMQPGRRGR